jgi:hypothetical protein
MSYYVRFKVVWGRKGFNPRIKSSREAVIAAVGEYVKGECRYDFDAWSEEFHAAFLGRGADIKVLDEEWAIELIKFVSDRFADVPFRARGRGEEREDEWEFACLGGRVTRERSFDGEREGVDRVEGPQTEWPRPLELSRVVSQAGSRSFIAEILSEQPATAEVASLTIKRRMGRMPRALVYVGPLQQEGYERIRCLIDDRYLVQQFRALPGLLAQPTATAEEPAGY